MTGYVLAETVEQALGLLAAGAVTIAGGTDLMIHLRGLRLQAGDPPEILVDITRIPELNRIEIDGDRGYLGAAVTIGKLERREDVRRYYPLLAQAASLFGSVQIRNAATLGGNVANASPGADGVTALLALGARAEIAGPNGVRLVPLEELIIGPNRTGLVPGELILGFVLDRGLAASGQVFRKIGRRQAMVIARVNLAVCVDEDLSDPRVALGACFPSPTRLTGVERLLAEGSAGPRLWKAAGEAAAQEFASVSGSRPSAAYKIPAVGRLVTATLEAAWEAPSEKPPCPAQRKP